MDASRIDRYVDARWDDDIVPQLIEYIRIPNKSPMFDADWEKHGYMADAVKLMASWARAQPIPGMQVEVVQLDGRTPLIYIEIPAAHGGSDDDCVLLYGHLDKQPEMTGWDEDLGPWKPVLRDGKVMAVVGGSWNKANVASVVGDLVFTYDADTKTLDISPLEAGS